MAAEFACATAQIPATALPLLTRKDAGQGKVQKDKSAGVEA